VWVSDIKDATAFRTEREARAVKRQVKDALAITKGKNGFFYVAGQSVNGHAEQRASIQFV